LNNMMSGNVYNFGVYSGSLSEYTQNIDTSNTVDGKPIYYWVDQKDRQIPSDAGFVGVVNGTNVTVRDLTLTKNSHGVLFACTENSRIENVTANSNKFGICLHDSSNNTITSNTANSNYYPGIYLRHSSYNTITSNTANSNNVFECGGGIYLRYSSYNTLANNNVSSNYDGGINLWSSSNNTITSNNASNNDIGIYLRYSSNDNTITNNNANSNNYNGIDLHDSSNDNTLTNNNASLNHRHGICMYFSSNNNTLTNNIASLNNNGIFLYGSGDNLIYNNYFNNTANAYDNGVNQWNITKTAGTNIVGGSWLGGNYWSDYAGNDTDGDGLGDTGLPHRGDFHPLIAPAAAVTPCEGDICVNTSGWWRDGGAFTASSTPIQAAVNAATAGETICVKAGSYTENVDIATSHLTLQGEGADVVTVRAANADDHVFEVTADWVNICGFVVTGATGNYKAGIHLDNADRCNILENNVSDNDYGIFIGDSNNNTLYHNNLINNIKNAYDTGTNQWNSGSEGNYYSDYTGIDTDGDGIGDTPYNISGGAGAQDRYPLMQPWNEGGSEFISIGSASAPTNSTITIPVSVANVTNILRISFDLLYNSSVISVSSVSANESFTGSSITSNNNNVNGITSIVLTNSNLISAPAETPVIDIAFNITGGSGSSTTLDLQNVEFSDAEFNPYTPAVVVDGQITAGIKGDFNGNGRVDIGDVAKVAFMVAGKVPEDVNADFNGNGRVDIGDAAKIAFYLAGKVSEL